MSSPMPDFRELSLAERIQLVEDIWDSIAAENPDAIEVTAAQREEIRRRVREHDADPATALPWEQVRARLLRRDR